MNSGCTVNRAYLSLEECDNVLYNTPDFPVLLPLWVDIVDSIAYDAIMQIGETPAPMSSITVRNLDPATKERLRIRAAEHGVSMEVEARRILSDAVASKQPREVNLAEAIRRRFAPFGGVELDIPPRELDRDPPKFE